MSENKVLFIGEKESFITRVLIKKVNDAGADCSFVFWSVNEINTNIDKVTLVILFMDAGEKPDESVLHFLVDIMEERSFQIIIIGEQHELPLIMNFLPKKLVYRTFSRPVDNQVFSMTIKEYMSKAVAGEFKKCILIVDDDPQYLTMVREWLKGSYKVLMANSGIQALKQLGKNRVDLILLDHEMPVTSGPQVLEMLRSDPETKSIPVMFLTGKGDKNSVMEVLDLKPEGYFLKGIERQELLKKLMEYFAIHKDEN